jgi:hypothetical protein
MILLGNYENMADTGRESLHALFDALADCEEQLKPFRHEFEQDRGEGDFGGPRP